MDRTTLIASGITIIIIASILALMIFSKKPAEPPFPNPPAFEGDGMGSTAPDFRPPPEGSIVASRIPAGRYTSTIYWRSERLPGSVPLDVLKETAAQMQREQQGGLGSDANARAIVFTLQAIATLEGRPTETEDGTPIIE
jgi:hypothetical protein